jgi:hypothetical protein
MPSEFAYRGREVSAAETEFIRPLIATHPGLKLAATLGQTVPSLEFGAAKSSTARHGRPESEAGVKSATRVELAPGGD